MIGPHIKTMLAAVLIASLAVAQPDFRAQAFAAQKAGKLQAAADLFHKLYEAGAADREILIEGARCMEKIGRFNDALDLLSRGKTKFPDAADFRVGLARVFNLQAASMLASSGKMDNHVVFYFQDAIREGEELLKTSPNNRDARLIVANSLYSIGEWDKVRPHAQELVTRFPSHPGGYIIMGDLAFGHYKLLRQQSAKDGADTDKETMQKIAGAREAARSSYARAIKLDVKRGVAHRKLGDVYAWNGQTDQALIKYGDALLLNPRAPVPHTWISANVTPQQCSSYYEDLGKRFLAGNPADKKPAAVFAWYCAAAATACKKFTKAESLYEAAIQLDPAFRKGYYYAMYSAYFYRENEEDAMRFAVTYAKIAPKEFSDIIRAVPDDEREPITQLIKYLAKQALDQRLAAGCRVLNHVLAGILDTANAWNNYGFMARESGKYDESEQAYRHALEIQPTSGQLMNDLGVILHFHKRDPKGWKEAEKLYVAALKAAQRVLDDGASSIQERQTARTTQQDATSNLKELRELLEKIKKG